MPDTEQISFSPISAEDPQSKALAVRLREWRLKKGLPIAAVARKMGFDLAVVYGWENGLDFPKSGDLSILAEHTGIEAARLLRPLSKSQEDAFVVARERLTLNGHPEHTQVRAFAVRLREWRKRKGLTLAQAAVQVGFSAAVLCEWENGRQYPSFESLAALSKSTGIPVAIFRRPLSEAQDRANPLRLRRREHSRVVKYADNPLVRAFATRLRQWRQEKGQTLKVIAAGMGVSVTILCEWEHGDRFPSVDHLMALAEYTGISASDFIRPLETVETTESHRPA